MADSTPEAENVQNGSKIFPYQTAGMPSKTITVMSKWLRSQFQEALPGQWWERHLSIIIYLESKWLTLKNDRESIILEMGP